MGHKLLIEPPFVLMRYNNDQETRGPGGLIPPWAEPKLFVLTGNEEHDCVQVHPIAWVVAKTLAPEAMARLSQQLRDARAADVGAKHRAVTPAAA